MENHQHRLSLRADCLPCGYGEGYILNTDDLGNIVIQLLVSLLADICQQNLAPFTRNKTGMDSIKLIFPFN